MIGKELQMYIPTKEDSDWLARSQVFCQRVQWATLIQSNAVRAAAPPSDPELAQERQRFVEFVKQPNHFVSAAKVAADAAVLAGATRNWPIRNSASWADEAASRVSL
jgi:hypothetical protein